MGIEDNVGIHLYPSKKYKRRGIARAEDLLKVFGNIFNARYYILNFNPHNPYVMRCQVLLAQTLPPEDFCYQVDTITQSFDIEFNIVILQVPVIVCCGFLIGIETSLQLPQFNPALNSSPGLGGSVVACKVQPIKLKHG